MKGDAPPRTLHSGMRVAFFGSTSKLAIASCAAMLATGICIHQRHVHVQLSEPSTYASPLHHKCGLLMLGCCAWALIEVARALAGSARNRTVEG